MNPCERCLLLRKLKRAVEHGDHAAELILRANSKNCNSSNRECNQVPSVVAISIR